MVAIKITMSGGIACPAVARQAAVAAGNPATVAAATAVLRRGGNAVDAALAAGFAAAVAEPTLTSLGGGGFMLVRSVGVDTLHDFFVDAPGRGQPVGDREPHFTPVTVSFSGADQIFHAGYGSVAVPGVLDGYLTAFRRYATLPLNDLVAPAQKLATEGVGLTASQQEVFGLLRDILSLTPEAHQTYGAVLTDGVLVNPSYAEFLSQVSRELPSGWRDAPGKAALLEQMNAHHGLLSAKDLDAYQVVDRLPRRQTFRGATVTSNPAPSFGGSIVAAALTEIGAEAKSANETGRLVAAMKALSEATSSAKSSGPQSSAGTTHISVIDADGMAVAMTTSNGSCSGVMVPDTGVQLNNVMGEEDLHPEGFHATEPGTRIGSMMAPTLLDLPDGTLVALGSGGSERIRSALLRVIVALVDGGYPLQEAVNAPRIHHDGATIHVEPGVRSHTLAALTDLAPVRAWPARNLYFGGVHAVSAHPDGRKEAASDPRRDGASAVVTID